MMDRIFLTGAMSLVLTFSGAAIATADPAPPPQPPILSTLLDRLIPAPHLPAAAGPVPAIAAAPGQPNNVQALREAIMPAPVGDWFFDDWPVSLPSMRNGEVIAVRDVTNVAGIIAVAPVEQAIQVKFRTTDAKGYPSFGTATLIMPRAPWTGTGGRPVLVNNLPIDSLGRACSAGYTLSHGVGFYTNATDFLPPATQLAALRGYAVLIPDHEGPRMAYAEPTTAGHIVLDSVRAIRNLAPIMFDASPVAMQGYSGGAIATNGATKLIDSYAPELAGSIVGAAMGGVPADFQMLTRTMNGNLATGVFHAAVLGIAREHSEMLGLADNLAQQLAVSPLKDMCTTVLGAGGMTFLPMEVMAKVSDPFESAVAQQIFSETKMAGVRSGTPLYIYNGTQEFWIPADGARDLYLDQCRVGASAVYREVVGEHFIAAVTGYPESLSWLDQRLQGTPATSECPR